MCLILSRGARDVHSGAKLTSDLITDYRIDDHQVFPRAYLDQHQVAARLRDCILNRTLIDRTTNKSLQTRTPAAYIGQLRTALGAEKLRELLRSHLLPGVPDSPLWRDDFEGFLARRQDMLWQEIQRVTGRMQATRMREPTALPPLNRAPAHAAVTSFQARGNGSPLPIRTLPDPNPFLVRQPDRTRHLWQALDRGICAIASDIVARATKGRRCVGGVSYYSPEWLFFCADFLRAGDGLTLSVFTGGQRWEGLTRGRSALWGDYVIRKEADLRRALAWARAAYEARKRVR
jgi:hypothetical protein